jgi:hypothetical protein
MARIRILSLDYDGCLARRDFHNNIVEHNQSLISELKIKSSDYAKTIVFIGSNRQSKRDNDRNSRNNNNGSSYHYIPLFCEAIKAEFNPFLLADIYNNAESGTAFREATDESKDSNFNHKGWFHDTSKISIIYSQIQKIAVENPEDEIDFEFYDDKENIIEDLYQFFSQNRQLIPARVNLNLYQYLGEKPVDKPTIAGNGNFVNHHYAESIKKFGDTVLTTLSSKNSLYSVMGAQVDLATVQSDQYNCGTLFAVKDYIADFVSANNPPEPLSANLFINILASKEMKIFAGIMVVAGLLALMIGSLGIGGVIAALAGTAAIVTTTVGGSVFIGGSALGLLGIFAPKSTENPTSLHIEQPGDPELLPSV